MSILTFLSDTHWGHHPPAEYLHGKSVPYFEMPARADQIQMALQNAGLIRPCEPETMDAGMLVPTHDPDMIGFLQHLSQNVQQIIADAFAIYDLQEGLTGQEYYYENLFPAQMLRDASQHPTARCYIYDNTSPVGQQTWDAALRSASLAYSGAKALLAGEARAYALCRPPGHHAGYATMGGYCYINNAAIAANTLRPSGKVAILDIDYHHGNGTQDIFWEDDDVLFVSIHADPAVDYPYHTGFLSENHASNRNIPLPHGTTQERYMEALEEALQTIGAFDAASLVVSLGWDTYKEDPMGKFELDLPAFAAIGQRIARTNLPTLYVQEGGYCIQKLGDIAVSFFRGVLEDEHAT